MAFASRESSLSHDRRGSVKPERKALTGQRPRQPPITAHEVKLFEVPRSIGRKIEQEVAPRDAA